jgi:hypothetical protein
MADKVKFAKFLRDVVYPVPPPFQRSPGRPTGLYLLELRSHLADSQSPISRRKLSIPVPASNCEDKAPEPVKITHS